MPVIYELRGKVAEFCDLGLNLFSGCTVGCRYCPDAWLRRMPWDKWTTVVRPQSNILSKLRRDAKEIRGDPREILVCPAGDPYQSDEAARLTRKAFLILEQYDLRVVVGTIGGLRSVRDFDIFARNRWKYAVHILFHSESYAESGSPARHSPSESRRFAKPMRRESLLSFKSILRFIRPN